MKLNIKQIAEMAQVSKGTVSKVINGQAGISTTTRERILKLVKQLDYHPDSSARALALQKTGILGFLIPHEAETSLSGQFWTLILSGITQQASRLGYHVLVLTTPEEGDIQGAVNQLLKRSTVDGLIIGSELLDKQSLSSLYIQRIPFVLLGQNPEFKHFCVDIDSLQGTSLMVDHMVAQGYRKIGALFGPEVYPYSRERHLGYLQSLDRNGLSWSAAAFSEYQTDAIRARIDGLLEAHPDMDALFLASGGDFLLDSFRALGDRNIRLPEFGLGVFDDYAFLDILTPKVTAIRQPLLLAGVAAVDLLLRLIRGETPDETTVRLPTTLIPRESCGEKSARK